MMGQTMMGQTMMGQTMMGQTMVGQTMVGQGGLEPPTPRLSSVCSNQLSY